MWIPRRSVQSIASWSSPTLALLGRISGWGIKTEACPVSAAGRRTRRSQVRPVLAERYSPKPLLPCLLDEMNKRTIIFLFWGSTWHVIDRQDLFIPAPSSSRPPTSPISGRGTGASRPAPDDQGRSSLQAQVWEQKASEKCPYAARFTIFEERKHQKV